MYFSKKLQKFKNVKHCFFSRKNGVSDGLYKSLNCGLGSKDKKENVLRNLELVSEKINCKKGHLITLNQTHSSKVVFFNHKREVKNKLLGDAIVTKIPNIGIGILTADCAPILLYEPRKKIIACVHSGWKGSFNRIIENTIQEVKNLNSNIDDLIAVVGPCIKKESYEVRIDFFNKFTLTRLFVEPLLIRYPRFLFLSSFQTNRSFTYGNRNKKFNSCFWVSRDLTEIVSTTPSTNLFFSSSDMFEFRS